MENAAPANAIILSNKVPSPLSFMVWRQERLVKKKPTDAPMALMSTNQPSASRPSTGHLGQIAFPCHGEHKAAGSQVKPHYSRENRRRHSDAQ